jgi:imidazoleglycerol-phosphate dehydratase
MSERNSSLKRQTLETEVHVSCRLDGSGQADIDLPIGFLQHMLIALAKHSRFDLSVRGMGDIEVDDHHLTEDVAITLGRALQAAWSEQSALVRYGNALLPMDDALVLVAVDISGRPYLHWDVTMPSGKVGSFDTELVGEFMRALAINAGLTLHVQLLHGENSHHISEAVFKGLGRALRQATRLDLDSGSLPSSKGAVVWQNQ